MVSHAQVVEGFEGSLRDARKRRDFFAGSRIIQNVDASTLSAKEWHEIARFYFAAKDYEEARSSLSRAAECYADGVIPVAGDLSLVYEKLGKTEAAIFFGVLSGDARHISRLVRKLIDAPDVSSVIMLAARHMLPTAEYQAIVVEHRLRLRDYETAEQLASTALKTAESAEMCLLLCRAMMGLKKYADAAEVIRTRMVRMKDNYQAHELLAMAEERQENYDAALLHLRKALELNPGLRSAYGKAAKLLYLQGDLEEARAYSEVAKERTPELASTWELAGHIAMDAGKYSEAIQNYCEEERISATYSSALNLAYAYASDGRAQEYREYVKKGLRRSYSIERRTWSDDRNLFVIFSPAAKPILLKYQFPGSALYFVDTSATYYTLGMDDISELVSVTVEAEKFENVVFIGSSKGAFAALAAAANVAKSIGSRVKVRALAFSPQIILYPYNENLSIPSYKRLMSRAKRSRHIKDALARYANASQLCANSPDFKGILLYGGGYRMDAIEASHMTASNIEKRSIAFSGHGVLMCYTIPDGMTFDSIAEKYRKLKLVDDDMLALGSEDGDGLINEMARLYFSGKHSLRNLIDEIVQQI